MDKNDDDDGEVTVPAVPPLKPVTVIYCGVCGVPPEYCEYGPKETYEKCKEWTLKNCPELVPQLKEQAEKAEAERKAKAEAAAAAAKAEGKDAPAEGEAPAAAAKPKKKKKEKPQFTVSITRLNRGKHKFITAVTGLENFGVKLPEASKMFGKRFACGCSVIKLPTGGEEINIQGDVGDDLAEFLQEKLNITEDAIVFEEDGKKK